MSFSNKIVRTMLPDDFKISRLITRNRGNHNARVRISAKIDENASTKNLTTEFNILLLKGFVKWLYYGSL